MPTRKNSTARLTDSTPARDNGFIIPDRATKTIFVHFNDIVDGVALTRRERVRYAITTDPSRPRGDAEAGDPGALPSPHPQACQASLSELPRHALLAIIREDKSR